MGAIDAQSLRHLARRYRQSRRLRALRGGRHLVTRGRAPKRNVVIEFRDYETAVACHDSVEYREAAKLRDAASDADLVIVEGYDGPQPG